MRYPDLYSFCKKLCPVSLGSWNQMTEILADKKILAEQPLFLCGDKTDRAFVIRKGIARNFYTNQFGKEQIKIFLKDGEIIYPYLESLEGLPEKTTCIAVTDLEGVVYSFSKMQKIVSSSLELTTLHLRLVQYFYLKKERREFELLNLSATERYELFKKEYKNYVEKIPQMYIASYLGINPVSLSRIRRRMKT